MRTSAPTPPASTARGRGAGSRASASEAKSICEKYLAPPHTTDFAILFLPTESLYAEVLRRPGLMDKICSAITA